jgi:diguanylate cyclase (GGDEF)-like protein
MTSGNLKLDSLTGVPNRKTLFEEQFKLFLGRAREGDRPFSLVFVDIDSFKQINERYGHETGDFVLAQVASMMQELAGESVSIARFGGDEFVLLFPEMEREQAFLRMEKIRATLEVKSFSLNGLSSPSGITISAGIASFPHDGRTDLELLRKADQALYRAKQLGRNSIRLAYDERMVAKTTHYTITQLERLSNLSQQYGRPEADLLREALDDLLLKYWVTSIESD